MLNLLIFILSCYGLTSILLYGKIFDSFRPNKQFFKCSQCMGFWSGVFVNILLYLLDKSYVNNILIGSFLSGCISSGTTYILDKIVSDDGIQIKNK